MTFKSFKWGTFYDLLRLWTDGPPSYVKPSVFHIHMQTVHFVTTLLCDHNSPPSNFLRYRFCPSNAVIAEEKETVGIVVPAMFRCQDVGTRLWSPCNYSPCHQFVRKEARVTRCLAVSGTVTHFQNYFLCVPLIETLSLCLFFKCVFDNLSSNSCVRRQQWAVIRDNARQKNKCVHRCCIYPSQRNLWWTTYVTTLWWDNNTPPSNFLWA